MPVPAWLSLALVGLAVVLALGTHRLLRRRPRRLRYLATAAVPVLVLVLLAAVAAITARQEAPAPAPAPPQTAADSDALIGALTPKTGTPSRGIRPESPATFDPAAFVRAQLLAALVPGQIVFNPPETMREGHSERVSRCTSPGPTRDARSSPVCRAAASQKWRASGPSAPSCACASSATGSR